MRQAVSAVVMTTLFASGILALRADEPATPKKPVIDQYHSIKVIDNYRWLDNAADPAVKKWIDASRDSDASGRCRAGT